MIRKKAALLLIFSNSYEFTMVRGIFYNSQILDKKEKRGFFYEDEKKKPR